jgi:hypothetical protein
MTDRRYLTFSLRTAFVVLTIGCLWLGWKVEKARKRGRAIDAIVAAGGRIGYEDRHLMHLPPYTIPANHFWLDRRNIPVSISIHAPLNAELG